MGLTKTVETQTETATWAADTTLQTDLLRNGAITRVYVTVEVTPSATLTGAGHTAGGIYRVLSGITIGAGGQTYFTLPTDDGGVGGELLHYLNVIDGFGPGIPPGRITAPARLYTPVTFVFHCGSRPKHPNGADNPFDLSAFIPATRLGRLTAQFDTDGNDVMDETVTITSAVIRYTTAQVLAGSEAELRAEMAAQGVMAAMQPAWEGERYSPTATATLYSDKRNIPVGGFIKRIALAGQDATADRPVLSNDEFTGLSVELPRDNTYLYRAFVDHQMALMQGGSQLVGGEVVDMGAAAIAGVFFIDLRNHTTYENPLGKDYGVDARGYGRGDILLGLTVSTNASGDDALILYEKYTEIAGALI